MIRILQGDCREVLRTLERGSISACVTDPPYHLTSIVKRFGGENAAPAQHGTDGAYARASAGFMGKQWDGGDIAFRPETWRLVFDVMKPGAFLVAFGGTRTFHRMACAIEDAGFEIRDTLCWLYGSGFPKSHDVSKGIDKAAGAERESDGYEPNYRNNVMGVGFGGGHTIQRAEPATPDAIRWQGWGTALKPAQEPIILCAKPLTVEHHIAICIDAITERLAWSCYSASDAVNILNGIRAKCYAVASSVLGSARTRSLVSIGSAPSAELVSTFSELDLSVPIKTRDCFALSHVRGSGSDQEHIQGSETQRGGEASLLTQLADMSMSAVVEPTSVSIVSSWLNISDELLAEASRFTISTAIRLTTALRTLNCSLLPNTTSDTGGLSPNFEPIILARRPLIGTVVANILQHGTGALNIDACRVAGRMDGNWGGKQESSIGYGGTEVTEYRTQQNSAGRWPANVLHDGSEEVVDLFPQTAKAGNTRPQPAARGTSVFGIGEHEHNPAIPGDNGGTASRFFYSAKADKGDRADSRHPTVKPVDLMRWLVRLVTPPGGTILDPFAGSGTTGEAAMLEGFDCIMIERDPQSVVDIRHRIKRWSGEDTPLFAEVAAE